MATALIRPHMLTARDAVEMPFPAGHTLADMARLFWPDTAVHRHVVAFVGDVVVPRHQWRHVRPKEHAVVRLALTAFEGGGGGGGKNILSIVAMIALTLFAPVAAGWILGPGASAFAVTALAAGITLVGSLAIAALFKPPMLDVGAVSTNPSDAATYSITGQANQATPYGPMLRVYGRNRIFPRLAAVPFTTTEGPHQYLYMLLDCGYGPLQIENIKIGDTPLGNYRDVLYRVHANWVAGDALEYYRNDTTYETMNLQLAQEVAEVRLTAPDASGIVLDFVLPRGLVSFDTNGNRAAHSVSFDAYVRPAGSVGAWTHARAYPTYVSRALYTPTTQQNIGAFNTYAQFPISVDGELLISNGSTSVRMPTDIAVAGDVIYLASQEFVTITAVAPYLDVDGNPVAGWSLFTITPTVNTYSDGVQSPILRTVPAPTDTIIVVDATPTPISFSLTVDVPAGAWEVQVIRRSAESTSDRLFDELVWTTIRSLADRPPVAVTSPHTLIELKIRASEQLSGVLQDVNCIATSILPVWTGAAWVDQPTQNPAWAYVDVLRGTGSIRPLALSRIDYAGSIKAWADYCDTVVANGVGGAPEARVRFDHVVDYATTTYQLLQSIAAAGRATPSVRDGKHGVIVDEEQTTPVQMFTPRNSWGFNSHRQYLTEPHALRIKFVDPQNNWQEGNVLIYASGFHAGNATTFEDLKLFGVTRYTQATRDGRYMKAQALLRREEFTINVDVENLIANRGDLVVVQHDVLQVGGDSSHIVAVAGDVIQLADPFGTLPPGSYGVRIRLANGTITAPIAATPIAPDSWDLAALPTPAPAVGDLVAWGFINTETGEYLVKQIAPGDELTATLTLAEIARDVYDADTGVIPAYSPPAGGRPTGGPGPAVLNLRVEQSDMTIAREPYCDLVVAWEPPQLGGYPKYKIAQISNDGVAVQVGETHLTRFAANRSLRLLDPDVTTPRTFSVVGVDAIGRQSLPAFVTFTPRDPLHVPGDAQYLSSNVHDKTTTLTWFTPDNVAVPGNAQILFYEVRWQPSGVPIWGSASRVTELVPWNVTTVTVPSRNGAYMVKATTASKVESAVAAVTVIAVEDLIIQDIAATHRWAPTWPGSFENCEVDGSGRLILTVGVDGTYPPVGIFYPTLHETFSELLQCRIASMVEAQGVGNTVFMADWVPLALAAPLSNVARTDWGASVWIAADPAIPFPMAEWIPLAIAAPLDPIPPVFGTDDWRPLLHGEYIARDLRFAVVLQSFKANVTPRVEQAGVDIDFPERQEEHADIVVPAGGLTFTFNRPFVFTPSVAVDLQDADPGDYVDRGVADQAGFAVFVRDSAGAGKAGVIDVSAFGVGRTF